MGFGGSFAVMSIRKFSVGYKVERQSGDKERKQKDESYDYSEESLEGSGEMPKDDSQNGK